MNAMRFFRQLNTNHINLFVIIMGLSLFSCSKKEKAVTDHSEPRTVLKLTPSTNNPRNSEGDFINLKDGRIIFVYTHFIGESTSDNAPAVLAQRYSDNGGITWTKEDEFIIPNEGGMNVMSVSLLRLQNGDIALFYLLKNSTIDCTPLMRISKDEAKSWGDAIPIITDKKGYFVLNTVNETIGNTSVTYAFEVRTDKLISTGKVTFVKLVGNKKAKI